MEDCSDPAAEGARPRLSVRLLGKPMYWHARTGRWHKLSPKTAALLALLISRGTLSRAEACALLWPDKEGRKPRDSLRRMLSDLRDVADDELFAAVEPLQLPSGVVHDLDDDATDAGELLGHCDFRDLFAFQDWLAAERERLRQRRLQRLGHQADRLQREGRLAEAGSAAEAMLALAPDDEAISRRLMRLHALAGRQDAALRVYAACKELLRRELQAEPSPATQQLALLIELNEPMADEPGHSPATAINPSRMVARERERGAIEDAWRRGRHVLLEGEPGVGKSHLARELAAGEPSILLAEARHGDAQVPFAALRRLLRAALARWRPRLDAAVRQELARLLPELRPASAAPAHMAVLLEALKTAWGDWHRAGLEAVIVEDLQWADEISVKLMLALAGTAPGSVRWMMTGRDGQRPHALREVLEQRAAHWTVLAMAPFDAAAVEQLLLALPVAVPQAGAWARTLASCCLGNPLHLLETVRAILQTSGAGGLTKAPPADGVLPIPARLGQLLQRRLEHLPESEMYLAQLAALAGESLSVALACELTGQHELAVGKAWAALESQGVLSGGVLGHDTLRQPLVDSLPRSVAQAMHARIAELAERAAAPGAEVARHWHHAERWTEAGRSYERAAREAFALNARDEELGLWDAATESHERAFSDAEAYAARLNAFDAALVVQKADALALRIETLLRLATTDDDRLQATCALARFKGSQYRWEEALAAARQSMALAEAAAPRQPGGLFGPHGLRAAMTLAAALSVCGQCEEALVQLQKIESEVDGSGDTRLQMDFAGTFGHVYASADRVAEAIEAYERGAQLAEALQDDAEAMVLRGNLGAALSRRGELARVLQNYRTAERWARKIMATGSPGWAVSAVGLGVAQVRLGHYADGLQTLHQAQVDLRPCGATAALAGCEVHLAMAYCDLGQADQAARSLETPHEKVPAGARAMRALADGLVRRLGGASTPKDTGPDAHEVLEVERRIDALLAPLTGEPLINRLQLELFTLSDLPPRAAAARCRHVAERAASIGATGTECAAWLHEAEAWLRAGDAAAARTLVCRMLAGMDACMPTWVYPGRIWWLAWRALRAAGDAEAAAQALARGHAWVMEHALPLVPIELRRGFLELNPVNRDLLAAARDQGLGPGR